MEKHHKNPADSDPIAIADEEYNNVEVDVDTLGVSTDSVKAYLRKFKNTPVLKAEEEVELSKRIEAGMYAQQMLHAAGEEDHTYRENWDALDDDYKDLRSLRLTARAGERAKEQLIKSNLRLVVSIAKRYRGYGLPFEDLIQEGNLGLIRAVEKFDYTKGFKFSTYATRWIQRDILIALHEKSRIIYVPRKKSELILQIKKAKQRILQETGNEATDEQIAEDLKIDLKTLSEHMGYEHPVISLDIEVGDSTNNDRATISDMLNDEDELPVDEIADYAVLHQEVGKALKRVSSSRNREFIRRRYGIGCSAQTDTDIASRANLSQQGVGDAIRTSIKALGKDVSISELREFIR